MQSMDNPLAALAVAAVFTALVQSSSATTGIVIVLASQGFVSLEAGMALVLGSMVGTCATAVLSALGKPRTALQVALVHVLINLIGAFVWLPFLGQLAELVRALSPVAEGLTGVERLAAETPRQIANAHTLVSFANMTLMIGFTGAIARLAARLAPVKPEPEPERIEPRYLDEDSIQVPGVALDQLRLEIARIGEISLKACKAASRSEGSFDATAARKEVKRAKTLYAAVLAYARKLVPVVEGDHASERLENMLLIAGQWQSLCDTLTIHFGALAKEWQERELVASDETSRMHRALLGDVHESIAGAVRAVREWDRSEADAVTSRKKEIYHQADALMQRLSDRLLEDAPNRLATYRIESQVVEVTKRLYYFARRVASIVADTAEEEEPEELA